MKLAKNQAVSLGAAQKFCEAIARSNGVPCRVVVCMADTSGTLVSHFGSQVSADIGYCASHCVRDGRRATDGAGCVIAIRFDHIPSFAAQLAAVFERVGASKLEKRRFTFRLLLYVMLHEIAHHDTPEDHTHGEGWQARFSELRNKWGLE